MRTLLAALALALAAPAIPSAAQVLAPRGVPDVPTRSPSANERPNPSICQAIARNIHDQGMGTRYASLKATPVALGKFEVAIRFSGHSTYVIESGEGIRAATDFSGWLRGDDRPPTIVTMNQAHASHYTANPDAAIAHVLPGWDPTGANGGRAEHHVTVGDMTVRNVTTDLRRYGSVPDGNSIFIFEVAGLCIGHLGHLHHMPTDAHFSEIGRLDVVMVPVDGGLTLSHVGMSDVIKRMQSRVILPMHLRSYGALPNFLQHMGSTVRVTRPREEVLILSARTLPKEPTIVLLPNLN